MAGVGVLLLLASLAAIAIVVRRIAEGRHEHARVHAPRPDWLVEPRVSPAEAEARSLELLRSVINDDEWQMFRELGFICVPGRRPARPGRPAPPGPRYRYLIYPHLPVVALLPRSMAPVREYCIQFPERLAAGGGEALPAGDDVLAKWMTLRSDEERLLAFANVASAGCQVPLGRIERDLRMLDRWQARRRGEAPPPRRSAAVLG